MHFLFLPNAMAESLQRAGCRLDETATTEDILSKLDHYAIATILEQTQRARRVFPDLVKIGLQPYSGGGQSVPTATVSALAAEPYDTIVNDLFVACTGGQHEFERRCDYIGLADGTVILCERKQATSVPTNLVQSAMNAYGKHLSAADLVASPVFQTFQRFY